jgi:hypothetical protein
MNDALELHDSRVGAFVRVGEQIIVFFTPAYLHRSKGRPGEDPGIGGWQAAALVISNAISSVELPDAPADIWTGRLYLGEEAYTLLPVPLQASDPTKLYLHLDTPTELEITGHGAQLMLIGDPELTETFPGSA